MRAILMFWLLLISMPQAFADLQCPGNVIFPQEAEFDVNKNKTVDLLLNGVGRKRVLFFNVFYGALYLENRSSNGPKIIKSREVKVFTIHALRDVSKKQIIDQWNGEFERLCGKKCDQLRPYHEELLSYAYDVPKGTRMNMAFLSDRLIMFSPDGDEFPPIKSPAYGRLMLEAAVGNDPGDESLKKGLLGQDPNLCKEI